MPRRAAAAGGGGVTPNVGACPPGRRRAPPVAASPTAKPGRAADRVVDGLRPARAATTCRPRAWDGQRVAAVVPPADGEVVPVGTADRGDALSGVSAVTVPTAGAVRESATNRLVVPAAPVVSFFGRRRCRWFPFRPVAELAGAKTAAWVSGTCTAEPDLVAVEVEVQPRTSGSARSVTGSCRAASGSGRRPPELRCQPDQPPVSGVDQLRPGHPAPVSPRGPAPVAVGLASTTVGRSARTPTALRPPISRR